MSAHVSDGHDSWSLDTTVLEYARQRDITEVLHFTTHHGLIGIGATGAVQSRDGLSVDAYLEHIYLPNCKSRLKDADWTGYVNLSITRVNKDMLGFSKNWHQEDGVWWCVLAFDAELLAYPGVYFATTNNIYPAVRRDTGLAGLSALFSPSVAGRYGVLTQRNSLTPANMPTDPQAEVLFPERVPLSSLRAIYVPDEDNIDHVYSLFGTLSELPRVPVQCKPEVFG